MRLRLWFIRETDLARRYCKLPKSRNPGSDTMDNSNYLWIPRSIVSHTQKRGRMILSLTCHEPQKSLAPRTRKAQRLKP